MGAYAVVVSAEADAVVLDVRGVFNLNWAQYVAILDTREAADDAPPPKLLAHSASVPLLLEQAGSIDFLRSVIRRVRLACPPLDNFRIVVVVLREDPDPTSAGLPPAVLAQLSLLSATLRAERIQCRRFAIVAPSTLAEFLRHFPFMSNLRPSEVPPLPHCVLECGLQAAPSETASENEWCAACCSLRQSGGGGGLLLLGSSEQAAHRATFEHLRVTRVLNCSDDIPNFYEAGSPGSLRSMDTPGDLRYLRIPIEDKTSVDLTPHIGVACDFVHAALSEGRRVLVHCAQGRSRSVAFICAYLIRFHGCALGDPATPTSTRAARTPAAAVVSPRSWHLGPDSASISSAAAASSTSAASELPLASRAAAPSASSGLESAEDAASSGAFGGAPPPPRLQINPVALQSQLLPADDLHSRMRLRIRSEMGASGSGGVEWRAAAAGSVLSSPLTRPLHDEPVSPTGVMPGVTPRATVPGLLMGPHSLEGYTQRGAAPKPNRGFLDQLYELSLRCCELAAASGSCEADSACYEGAALSGVGASIR